jgi:hypothetical protein
MYKKLKKILSSLIFSPSINFTSSRNESRGLLLKNLNLYKEVLQLRISCPATPEKQRLERALTHIDFAIKSIDEPVHQYMISITLLEAGQLIGEHINSLQSKFSREYLLKLINADAKVQLPRQHRVFAAQGMKRYVQNQASELWSQEAFKHMRISEMSETVWSITYEVIKSAESDEFLKYYLEHPKIVEQKVDEIDTEKFGDIKFEDIKLKGVGLFIKAFPDKPEGMKKWLREIAPDEASARGRDKLK